WGEEFAGRRPGRGATEQGSRRRAIPTSWPPAPGDVEGFAIQFISDIGMPLLEQQLAFEPVQLSCEPALPFASDALEAIVQHAQTFSNYAQSFSNLPRDSMCCG